MPFVDSLLRALDCSRQCDSLPRYYGRYDPNQLSSGHRTLYLLPTWALTSHDFKLWVLWSSCRHSFCTFPSSRRECWWIFCRLLTNSFMPVLDYRFTIDCPSHVRRHPLFNVKTIFGVRCSLIPLVSQPGTEIKLLRRWRLLCWASSLHSTSTENPFPSILQKTWSPIVTGIGNRYHNGK